MRISWFPTENPTASEVVEAITGALKMSTDQGMLLADTLANVEEYVPQSLVASALPGLRLQVSDPVALGWLEIYADPERFAACKSQST